MNNVLIISHYIFKKTFVYNDMLIVVWDLNFIHLKYLLETIHYNKVNPLVIVGSSFHNGRNYKIYFFCHK